MAEIVIKQLSSDDAGNHPKTQLRQWVPVPPTPESRPNVNFFDQGFSWPGRYADETRVATTTQRLAPTGCHLSDDMESTASTAKERLECKHCTLSIHLTVLCNYSLHSTRSRPRPPPAGPATVYVIAERMPSRPWDVVARPATERADRGEPPMS